jgi:hypothetical protein
LICKSNQDKQTLIPITHDYKNTITDMRLIGFYNKRLCTPKRPGLL